MKKMRHVRIVEAIPLAEGAESKIVMELLRMLGALPTTVLKVERGDTKKSALKKILDGRERYVHISSHGTGKRLALHEAPKLSISPSDVNDFRKQYPDLSLSNRFLTVSACGSMDGNFAPRFGEATGATAVIAPMASVDFGDSALFYSIFYYALACHPTMDESLKTPDRLTQFVDAFQRTKIAFLTMGGGGVFRLDWWLNDEHAYVV